jgi:hypothetical protein
MPSSGIWRRVDSCVNRLFGGMSRLHLQGRKIRERGIISSRWNQTHISSLLADFYTLKMEAIHSSESSVHTRSTRRHIPEDGILHSHRCGNLKSYIVRLGFAWGLSSLYPNTIL